MTHHIILKDIPKSKVQIDLWPFDIQGGFRGFQKVHEGLHYIATWLHDKPVGMWCYVSDKPIISGFDWNIPGFVDLDSESEQLIRPLAESGAMDTKLISYPDLAAIQWKQLTCYIHESNYHELLDKIPPIALDIETEDTILAHFQMAFLKIIVMPEAFLNPTDWNNWNDWISAVYEVCNDVAIAKSDIICQMIDLLILQQKIIPPAYTQKLKALSDAAMRFINRLIETKVTKLSIKANHYRFFLF